MVDYLLTGRFLSADEEPPGYDGWAPYLDYPDAAGTWRQYRAWLLAEWERRGGTGAPWGAQFDGQGGQDGRTTDGT